MKLRINANLHARARDCSDAVNEPLSEWIAIAWRAHERGDLDQVAPVPDCHDTSAAASTVITIRPLEVDPATLRDVIARAVAYCEARNPPPFTPPGVEGIDYLIEKDQ